MNPNTLFQLLVSHESECMNTLESGINVGVRLLIFVRKSKVFKKESYGLYHSNLMGNLCSLFCPQDKIAITHLQKLFSLKKITFKIILRLKFP